MSEHQPDTGTTGLPDPGDVPAEDVAEIEREREERLDPDNRPDGTEIDNTDRDFDSEAGMFTDNPAYDPDAQPYAGGE